MKFPGYFNVITSLQFNDADHPQHLDAMRMGKRLAAVQKKLDFSEKLIAEL
jgi:hypothetical protein